MALHSHNEDEMTSEEFKQALRERLYNQGVTDSIRAMLRSHWIAELRGDHRDNSKTSTLQKKVIDSLIFRYLCTNGYDYTVGVFLPEVGMKKSEVLSGEDLTKVLNVSGTQSDEEGEKSLLQLAINQLMRTGCNRSAENGTQTESGMSNSLADRFAAIERDYNRNPQPDKQSGGSIEEKLLSFQRKAEQTANQKAQSDFERWKKLELDVIRLQENENIRKETEERRKQLEAEYRKKLAAVTEREKTLSDSVKLEYETVQRELFQQRQLLLQQTEQLRRRENEIRNEKEQMTRSQRLSEEKVEKMEAMLKKRETEIHHKELHLDNTLRNQQERCRLEEKLAYDTRYRELKAMEEKLKDKELSVDREKRSLLTNNERTELIELRQKSAELDAQARKYHIEVASLEMKISGLQERLAKVYDYEVIKEMNISLKKDLEMTKERLEMLMKEHSLLQEKYEHLIIDGKEKAGLGEIMLIKTQMQRERDKALDDKVILEHRLREAEGRLADQMRKNKDMVREYESLTDRQRYMNKEYGEMRKQLGSVHHSNIEGVSLKKSPMKEQSYFDTSFRQTLPPELNLEHDWPAGDSSCAEVSTATEESIVTETRKRLDYLSKEADNLHSAYQSLTRASPPRPVTSYPLVQTSYRGEGHVAFEPLASPVKPNLYSSISAANYTAASTHAYQSADYTNVATAAYTFETQPTPSIGLNDRNYGPPSAQAPAPSRQMSAYQHEDNALSGENFPQPSQADQFNRPTPNKPLHVHSHQNQENTTSTTTQHKPLASSSSVQSSATARGHKEPEAVELQSASSPAQEKTTSKTQPVLSLDNQWESSAGRSSTGSKSQSLADKWSDIPANDEGKQEVVSLDSQWKTQDQHKEAAVDTDKKKNASLDAAAESKDDMAGIDPVMQKYMKMLQQQKPAEKAQKTPTPAAAEKDVEEDNSISDHVSLAKSDGAETDENFW